MNDKNVEDGAKRIYYRYNNRRFKNFYKYANYNLCIMRIFDEHSFFFLNFINNVNFCKIIAILNNFSTNICTSFDYVRLIKGYGN